MLILREKIEAPKIIVEKKNNCLFFYKKNKEINLLDKILTQIYQYPITYFNNFIDKFESNKKYYFAYIYKSKPVNTEYSIPKNNLLLTNIVDNNNTYFKLKDFNLFNTSILDEIEISNENDINIDRNSILLYIENNKIVKRKNLIINKKENRSFSDFNSFVTKDIIKKVYEIIDNNFEIKGNTYYEKYIFLIYDLYKLIDKNINIEIQDIFKDDIFRLNYNLLYDIFKIQNLQNPELFKFMLNLFKKDKYINAKFITKQEFKKLKYIIYKINNLIKSDSEFQTFKEFLLNV
jgi:hypothetical protein